MDLIPLELKSPYFYHLDTCFAPLTEHTAVIVKEAFTNEGLALLQSAFDQLIEDLQVIGFKIHALNTSEFLKSGGSVFCLKLHIW